MSKRSYTPHHKKFVRRCFRILFFNILMFSLLNCRFANTFVPTSTPQFTEEQTVPISATLEREAARYLIQTWLATSPCEAPCFWDIVPASTSLNDALSKFRFVNLQLELVNTRDDKYFYGLIYDLDNRIRITPTLVVKDNLVQTISLSIVPNASQGSLNSNEWSAFSLDELIRSYGEPSKVELSLGQGEFPSLEINVYFASKDLIVQYYSYDISTSEGVVRICPLASDYSFIRLWFGKEPENPPFPGLELEQISSLSIKEFSRLITDSSNPCLALREGAFLN